MPDIDAVITAITRHPEVTVNSCGTDAEVVAASGSPWELMNDRIPMGWAEALQLERV